MFCTAELLAAKSYDFMVRLTPPSITIDVPVMYAAKSLAKKRQQFAMSTGKANLKSGILLDLFRMKSLISDSGSRCLRPPSIIAESTKPGITQLTLTPNGAYSTARLCVNPRMAALEAV